MNFLVWSDFLINTAIQDAEANVGWKCGVIEEVQYSFI